jgi:hypothetical protein
LSAIGMRHSGGEAAPCSAKRLHKASVLECQEGIQRKSFTAIGFDLWLGGIYALRGRTVTWHKGCSWVCAASSSLRLRQA